MTGLPAVLVLVHKLGRGGLTRAVIDQTAIFADLGHETTILTLDPGGEQMPREALLRDQGRLRPEVHVRNIHQEARDAWAAVETGPAVYAPAWADDDALPGDLLREDGRDNKSMFSRYYDTFGAYVALVRRHPTGTVWQITTYQDRVAVSSEMFGMESELVSTSELEKGKPVVEQWLSAVGTPYLSRVVRRPTRRGKVVARLPGTDGADSADSAAIVIEHRSMIDWQLAWLQSVVDAYPQPPIVLAESPSAIPKAAALRSESAITIGMLHNNQFDEPYRRGAPVRDEHRRALESVADVDAMVVLTEDQRTDVVELFGHPERWRVVPNSTDAADTLGEPEPGLVVLVTRLDPLKAIDETIHAFVRVREHVPHARLEIFGGGPALAALEALVTDLGLQDAVELRGRTDTPEQELARASATTLTSTREAMPLAVLEAHAAGTPVVSYDFSYGPRSLISDGVDGFVVPWGDRDALADRLVALLSDPELAGRLGRAGHQRILARHHPDVVAQTWAGLFADLRGARGRAAEAGGGARQA